MKAKILVISALVLISLLGGITIHDDVSTRSPEQNTYIPYLRASPALDWNGSFPYNIQALPLYTPFTLTTSALGDVNSDGYYDAVVGSYSSAYVFVYLNHGGFENLTPEIEISSTEGLFGPTDVQVVDRYVAVSCHKSGNTGSLNQDKVMLFNITDLAHPLNLSAPVISTTYNLTITALAVGDFNNDGTGDLAAAFSVYDQSASSNLSKIAVYYAPFSKDQQPDRTINLGNNVTFLLSGDFNEDGKDDLAVIGEDHTKVIVYYQGGNGLQQNSASYISTTYATYLATGDLNGDGFSDLAVSDPGDGIIRIYFSTPDGISSSSLDISSNYGTMALAIGDFNSDGYNDLLVSYRDITVLGKYDAPRYMRVYNGPFSLSSSPEPSRLIFGGYNIIDMHVHDVNNDGMDDVLVLDAGERHDSDGGYTPYILYQRDGYLKGISDESLYGGIDPTSVALGDINGDSLNDIIIADSTDNATRVYLNRGDGFYLNATVRYNISGYPNEVASGNFDNDGKDDIVVSRMSGKNISMLLSSSGNWINLTTEFYAPWKLGVGDIDGDGLDDIFVISINNTKLDIFLSTSGYHNGEIWSKNISLTNTPVDLAPLNHLGNSKGLAVLMNNTLEIYNYTSAGTFEKIQEINIDSNYIAESLSIGDFNGDGREDLAVAVNPNTSAVNSGAVGVFIQDGRLFPSTPDYVFDVGAMISKMACGDFNDDSFSDISITTTFNLIILGYFNGSGFTEDYLAGNVVPDAIASGDINGDGKDDMVTISRGPVFDYPPMEIKMVDIYYQKDYPPIANISGPGKVYEGSYVNLTAENSTDSLSDINTLNYTWYLKNGTGWDMLGYGINISYFAAREGNYTFLLKVTDKEGLSGYALKNVTVLDSVPQVDFTPGTGTEGIKIEFHALIHAYDGVSEIYWDMNSDGIWDYKNLTSVNYTYAQQGEYHVNLTVIDGDGSVGYANKTVIINDTAPTCNFTYSPSAIYEGKPVHFVAYWNSYDPVINWTWDFGTAISYGKEVNYGFPSQGNYVVELKVRDSDGSVSTSNKTIIVMDTQPEINFTYSGIYEGEEFSFYAHVNSYDSISSYFWDFGDGSHAYVENPVHIFSQNGTYLVTLYVNDSDGSNVSYSMLVEVQDRDPTVSFNYTHAIEGKVTHFTANVDSYDGIVSIHWDFGDGSSSNELNPNHTYQENGTYRVTVTVREKDGDEASSTEMIVVEDTSPDVVLTANTTVILEDSTVKLSANGTTAYDGIKQYLWDFDYHPNRFSADLITTAPVAITTYPEKGVYTVALMVVDGDGSASYGYIQITVENVEPVANFTYTMEGNTVIVNASASYDTPSDREHLDYIWDFGDGSPIMHGPVVKHIYKKPGTYTITLTVRDNDGAVSKMTRSVKITEIAAGGSSKTPWYILLFLIPIVGGALALLLYIKGKKTVIDDVYLISDSGILIHHATRRLKPEMDEDILSSMLIAIQEFVQDAFKSEDATLKSMDFGNKKIQIHRGKHLFLAVVSSSNIPKKMESKIREILNEIEEKYGKILEHWDGDVSAFRGVGDILKKIWE